MPMFGSRGGGSSRGFGGFGINPFTGGNQSADTVVALSQRMLNGPGTASATAGGTLTLNSVSLGSYDYSIKLGNQTVSSFTTSDWFTGTQDTRSAWIAVNGNLTINSGITFTPSVRKLFTVIYVNGNLTINGTISMSQRGANHSAVGAGAILITTGTYSAVANPQISASGGAGGGKATNGTAGSSGGTGGGGGGGGAGAGVSQGAAGTSFTGGSGGGGDWSNSGSGGAASAVASGGSGGHGYGGGWYSNGGGAGNPGGNGQCESDQCGIGDYGNSGGTGTGGVLIFVVAGTYSGSGSITAAGSGGGAGYSVYGSAGGAGSGGGSITVLVLGTNSGGPSVSASGGSGGSGTGSNGGSGGTGTARVLGP